MPAVGPIVASLPDLPALAFDGVVIANELLDNLPFGIAVFDVEEGPAAPRACRPQPDRERYPPCSRRIGKS